LLALWRMIELQAVIGSIRKQMRNLSSPQANNPLGRVLGVLGPDPQLSDLDTLELKLDEAVMQEVPRLERGQGLLKLLAAVAPCLVCWVP
jgi:biopolymer transport protein ExbB